MIALLKAYSDMYDLTLCLLARHLVVERKAPPGCWYGQEWSVWVNLQHPGDGGRWRGEKAQS